MAWTAILATIAPYWPLFGIPLLRNLAGWAKNALADGIVEPYEWRKLADSSVNVILIGLGTMGIFQFSSLGVDVSLLSSMLVGAVIDWIVRLRAKTQKKE